MHEPGANDLVGPIVPVNNVDNPVPDHTDSLLLLKELEQELLIFHPASR